MTPDYLTLSPEVAEARATNAPIVALESTIITHGMPYPQNLETARQVEDEVRAAGALPATIAILEGRLHVGLTSTELEALAQAKNVMKLSRADLAVALATGRTGATTVAATMIAAHLAGIGVFATGGIGGVHKGAEDSFDISADLMELAQTPVTVVAAGAKAILDIPKTLEVLETQGVPVIAFGQDDFPAFWSRKSGLSAPLRMNRAEDIAASAMMRGRLGLPGGQLVANPIPESDEIAAETLAPIIAQAQAEADAHGISGKSVTPFLLQRLFELTEGRSLTANIALVLNNARLASAIACAMVAQD
ncbi:pseudouridine-5'-phosphate glycosidase [Nioella sediminis]|jgi:pseudouridine-5'-phosphate glycosidase|uniref:pseudouridine-5'-phosphate glycosidase n=1 Tax=Nioella sediminis TaxID=1912092 RepID=UPI0008FD7112|nr:pseudouridine-5'-phosphate glycosidase [Nioella sediminis]TBX27989.1 pseudouridine-5'-phosphate glycosidase [Roseovarius sp. JS7-11]